MNEVAEFPNESAQPAETGSNLSALVAECAEEMVDIQEMRRSLNEKAAKIRERLDEAGVKPKAFDYALRLRDMEAEAKAEYMESLQNCFDALDIGAQLNFLDADG